MLSLKRLPGPRVALRRGWNIPLAFAKRAREAVLWLAQHQRRPRLELCQWRKAAVERMLPPQPVQQLPAEQTVRRHRHLLPAPTPWTRAWPIGSRSRRATPLTRRSAAVRPGRDRGSAALHVAAGGRAGQRAPAACAGRDADRGGRARGRPSTRRRARPSASSTATASWIACQRGWSRSRRPRPAPSCDDRPWSAMPRKRGSRRCRSYHRARLPALLPARPIAGMSSHLTLARDLTTYDYLWLLLRPSSSDAAGVRHPLRAGGRPRRARAWKTARARFSTFYQNPDSMTCGVRPNPLWHRCSGTRTK